jgi:Phage integrase, N-terminal SAM-like domain
VRRRGRARPLARTSRRAGSLAQLDRGTETLDAYVTGVWVPAHAPALAPNTRRAYAYAYDRHISPRLGGTPLHELTPDAIARLQADLLAGGLGHAATRKAVHVVLKGILTRAVESHRITVNPARAVRMARAPQALEVRPLAPATVEQLRDVPRRARAGWLAASPPVRPAP